MQILVLHLATMHLITVVCVPFYDMYTLFFSFCLTFSNIKRTHIILANAYFVPVLLLSLVIAKEKTIIIIKATTTYSDLTYLNL